MQIEIDRRMQRTLTATRAGRCLATAIGVVVALACVVALPAHAQAATVAWSSVKPAAAYCGAPKSVSTGYGYANIRECLKVARSASGTGYYNGVLEVTYHRLTGSVGDVLGAKSMIARVNGGQAIGVNDCPRQRWVDGETRWCYSPTTVLPTGHRIYGKGVLTDHTGRWIAAVWSPVVPDKAG